MRLFEAQLKHMAGFRAQLRKALRLHVRQAAADNEHRFPDVIDICFHQLFHMAPSFYCVI